MYIPDFSFLAQFGGELCEEQTRKIRKPNQKTTSFRLLRGEMELKSLDPKKGKYTALTKCTSEWSAKKNVPRILAKLSGVVGSLFETNQKKFELHRLRGEELEVPKGHLLLKKMCFFVFFN